MGNPDDVHKAAPGLCHDLWQEGDGNVLIYGGDAQSLPDEIFLSKLKRLRSGQPVDGIIQVMSTSALPTDSERDAFALPPESRSSAGLAGTCLAVAD
jgi:type VI secretion system protein ImpL